jgi:hypothetical protein
MADPQLDLDVAPSGSASIVGEYRYTLTRRWEDGPRIGWVMLNPSTADAEVDDPTIRRCIGFSQRWGYGSMIVANLFARRATDPVHLSDPGNPVGPANGVAWRRLCEESVRLVAGWGAHPEAREYGLAFHAFVRRLGHDLWCLGTTKDGSPRHPLYVRGDTELVRWP